MVRTYAWMVAIAVLYTPFYLKTEQLVNFCVHKDPNSYGFKLTSAQNDKSLFIVPNNPASTVINQFFDASRTQFIFDSERIANNIPQEDLAQEATPPQKQIKFGMLRSYRDAINSSSYRDAIDSINEQESKFILKQQAYLHQTKDYFMEKLFKTSDTQKAQVILRAALDKLDRITRETLQYVNSTNISCMQIDITNKKAVATAPYATILYNATKEFLQILGVETPSIEEPWYMRHKWKIAFTAGTLALLTYAYYSSKLGTQVAPVSTQPAPTTGTPIPAQQPSWLQAKFNATSGRIGNWVSGQVGKALVASLAKSHANISPQTPSTISSKLYDWIGKQLVQHLAESQGTVPTPTNPSFSHQVGTKLIKWYLTPEGGGGADVWKTWKPKF